MAYLRERRCVAEQVDAVAIDVWPPPLLHQNGNGNGSGPDCLACASCGEPVEAALQRLGSPRCHDCRGRMYTDDAGRKSDARDRGRQALRELDAHLKAWRTESGAAAAIVDAR